MIYLLLGICLSIAWNVSCHRIESRKRASRCIPIAEAPKKINELRAELAANRARK